MDIEVFNEAVRDFEALNMHYVLVDHGGDRYYHRFPGVDGPSDIRSISKTVLALAAGIVADTHSDFDENTYIWPILQNVATLESKVNLPFLEKLQVKHLLTHTIGYDEVLLMRGDIKDLDEFKYVDYVINSPIVHEPGAFYLYSNAGFYLLSVTLQEFLGQDLLTYIDDVLFSKVGITDFRWEKYGNYLAGATRLWLYPHDLLAIGRLLMADGRNEAGDGVVPAAWIDYLKQPTTLTPGVDTPSNPYFRRYAYASGLWLGEREDIFFGHGTDGQTLAIVPHRDAVVVTTAHQEDVTRLEQIVDRLIASMYE